MKLSENINYLRIVNIVIFIIGTLGLILSGALALRFPPSWKLDTNMESYFNPNSDFLTSRPANYYEPIDSAILTQPVWINVFLTPGASIFETRMPMPFTNTPFETNTPVPTVFIPTTNTLAP